MRQYAPKQLAVPAGTTSDAPVTASWQPYPAYCHAFRITIPSGHNGLTGVRIVIDGTPVIPFDLASWLTGSGTTFEVPFGDDIPDSGLTVQGFNTDVWPHTFYLYADIDPYHQAGIGRAGSLPDRASASLANLAAIGQLEQNGTQL